MTQNDSARMAACTTTTWFPMNNSETHMVEHAQPAGSDTLDAAWESAWIDIGGEG